MTDRGRRNTTDEPLDDIRQALMHLDGIARLLKAAGDNLSNCNGWAIGDMIHRVYDDIDYYVDRLDGASVDNS